MLSLLTRWIKVFMVLQLISLNATAETLKDPDAARALVERIMQKVGVGDTYGGIQMMRPYLIIPSAEFDVMIDQAKLQQPTIDGRFGKSIGHEFIREERAGEHLLRIVQIHLFERHVMRWTFYFYQANGGWILNTFRTDDDLTQLFGK